MKHASVATLVALGFLTIPALADAQPKPAGAPPEPAPRGAAEPAQPSAPADADTAADDAADDDAAPAPAAPAPGTPSGAFTPMPAWPEPGNDAAELKRQNAERPTNAGSKRAEGEVFAEDWWAHARPVLELHGNFRVRAEMFYQFALGRVDVPEEAMWPQPADNYFKDRTGFGRGPQLCTPDEIGAGSDNAATSAKYACSNNTQMMGNLRFRLDPVLHISDNLRVISQVDLFDNLVLGSTPNEYRNVPYDSQSGYAVASRSGYAPIGFNTTTTEAPTSGVNSLRDSIRVKRAWAEYATPVGELRFGRMPNHWGLGILNNAGDGYDDNYQSTIDRIQFTTGFKPLDLYVTGAWDFINEGATSDNLGIYRGQPYDVAQSDDVSQYMLAVTHRKSREMTRLSLARGEIVLNAGIQVQYRHQLLADDVNGGVAGTCNKSSGAASLSCSPGGLVYQRRGASTWTPDLWLQLLYKKFRFEAEAVTIQGNMDNASAVNGEEASRNLGYKVRQYGIATEIEQRLVEDKLRLGFNFGWASGDSDVQGLAPPYNMAQSQHGDRTDSTFRFNPAYNVDLILYRNILTRVQGTYFFKPSASYDFLRDASGQKLGGSVAAIWSRASEFVQAPGHARDLGIELNAAVYFQSKDGGRNDDPNKKGGFFTKIEYGVLFPMAGLGYTDVAATQIRQNNATADTNTAQTLRWYMGVFF